MSDFATKRKDMIRKKNDFYVKSAEMKDSIEKFDKKRSETEEGISRIPTDLPPELQSQVDTAVENVRNQLKEESNKLDQEADKISIEADEAMDLADKVETELREKSKKMSSLSGVPLIGSFAETKGNELMDQAEQMVDLRQETQKYQDELISYRNKLKR